MSESFRSSRNAGKTTTERGYGHDWRNLRKSILQNEPLCRTCNEQGRVTLATEVDHLIPKARGGTNDPDNLQSICHDCHVKKTQSEAGQRHGAAPGAAYAVPVTVVCGPPGCGKTTYVNERKRWGDLVLDIDHLWCAVSGLPMYEKPEGILPFVLDCRAAIIARLTNIDGVNHAWVITGGGRSRDRELHRKRGAHVVVIETPAPVCIGRIRKDPARTAHVKRWQPIIADWWTSYRPHDDDERIKAGRGDKSLHPSREMTVAPS